jgi:hypothetical protein
MWHDFNNLTLALSTPERLGRVTKVDRPKPPVEPMRTMSFRSCSPAPNALSTCNIGPLGKLPGNILESAVTVALGLV